MFLLWSSFDLYIFKKIYLDEQTIFFLEKITCWLHLGFSHKSEDCFRHDVQEFLSHLCTCSLEIENISNYLLHSHHKASFRIDVTNSVETFAVDFESLSNSKNVEILLYGDYPCDAKKNNSLLSASINHMNKTKRFDCSFFWLKSPFPTLYFCFGSFYFHRKKLHLIYIYDEMQKSLSEGKLHEEKQQRAFTVFLWKNF